MVASQSPPNPTAQPTSDSSESPGLITGEGKAEETVNVYSVSSRSSLSASTIVPSSGSSFAAPRSHQPTSGRTSSNMAQDREAEANAGSSTPSLEAALASLTVENLQSGSVSSTSPTGTSFPFAPSSALASHPASSESAAMSAASSAEMLESARIRAAASAAVEVAAKMSALNINGSSTASQPMLRTASGGSAGSSSGSTVMEGGGGSSMGGSSKSGSSSHGHPWQAEGPHSAHSQRSDSVGVSEPTLPFKDFMQDAKARLMRKLRAPLSTDPSEEEEEAFVLIMGNDACDSDSVMSSICLSYLLTVFPKQALEEASTLPSQGSDEPIKRRKRTAYIPIIQSFQEDSRLRPENMLVLQLTLGGAEPPAPGSMAGSAPPPASAGKNTGSIFRDADSPPECLVWLDDVVEALQGWQEGEWRQKHGKAASGQTGSGDRKNAKALKQDLAILAASEKLSPSNGVRFGLVDHNRVGPLWFRPSPFSSSSPSTLQRQVLLVLDHHADEQAHPSPTESAIRIVKTPDVDPVGSCASLVTLLFKNEIVIECTNIGGSAPPDLPVKLEGEDRAAAGSPTPSASASGSQAKRQAVNRKVPMAIADLLLGPIALDTDNLKMAPKGKATAYDAAAFSLLLPMSSFSDSAARSYIWSAVSMLLPKFLPSTLITPALFEDGLEAPLAPLQMPPLIRKTSIETARGAAQGSDSNAPKISGDASPSSELASPNAETNPPEIELAAVDDLLQAEPESDLLPSAAVMQVLTDERITELASVTTASWKALAATKASVVHTLGAADMLQRDCKIVAVPSPLQLDRPLQVAFATVPNSLSALIYGHDKPAFVYPEDEREKVWDAFYAILSNFVQEKELDAVLCLMSYRQGVSEANPKGKHAREIIVACRGELASQSREPRKVFAALCHGLEQESYLESGTAFKHAPTSPLRLMLEAWKGLRIRATGKRDRLDRVDSQGLWMGSSREAGSLWVQAYRQRNEKANRKVILPCVLSVLQHPPL